MSMCVYAVNKFVRKQNLIPVLKLQDIDLESIPIPEPCSPDIPEKQDTERRVVRRVEDHEETDEKPEHYEEEVVVEEVVEEDVVVASAEDKKLFDSMMNNLINTRTEAEKEKGSRYLVRYLTEL